MLRLKELGGFLLEGITITLTHPNPAPRKTEREARLWDDECQYLLKGRWKKASICLTVRVRFLLGTLILVYYVLGFSTWLKKPQAMIAKTAAK